MEIDAITAAAKLSTPFQQPADTQQNTKFALLMQQIEPPTPMMSPDHLLPIQSEWMHATLAVDLTAKVVGVVGQNINKLVNMQ